MKKSAKEVALCGVMTALLIGSQYVCSFIAGVEIVTAIFLAFCVRFGVVRGLIVATAFSILRCCIFGFYPSVIVLYLIYYNLFAIVFGLLGAIKWKMKSIFIVILYVVIACLMTCVFYLIDAFVAMPIFYLDSLSACQSYFIASLPILFPQLICVATTTLILYYPLNKVFLQVKI